MSRPRVLLVDDSLTLQMTLQDALVAAGFAVVACKNGWEARRALRNGSYALLILDVLLPDTSGIELAQEARSSSATSAVPIILLSASAEIGQRVTGVAAGANDFIGKFCGPPYVVKRARQLSRMQGAGDDSGPFRVLLVDDSPTFLNALSARLRLGGHDVIAAKSSTDALDYLAVQGVDAVVLDALMPGINGLDMCRRIKSTPDLADTPVMMMSSREDAAMRTSGAMAGVDDFMVKSSDVGVMISRLDRLLKKRRGAWGTALSKTAQEDVRRTARAQGRGDAGPPSARPSDSRRDVASSRAASTSGERDRAGGTALFERVVGVCGLSSFIASSSVKRAFMRAGVEVSSLTPEGLSRVLPELRLTLAVFLPPAEVDKHMELIAALTQERS